MFNVELFRIGPERAELIKPVDTKLEKDIHLICEQNLDSFFGVTLVRGLHHKDGQHYYKSASGRGKQIDTLGVDDQGHPVVIEYKRDKGKTIVNQALDYADWVEDRMAEFRELVHGIDPNIRVMGGKVRIVCIARDFEDQDISVAKRASRDPAIDLSLVRYQIFGNNIVGFQQIFPNHKLPTPTTTLETHQPPASPDTSSPRARYSQKPSDNLPESFWSTTWRIRKNLTNASGRYLDDHKSFVVLEGSVIDIRSTDSFNERPDFRKISRRRREVLDRYPNDGSGTIALRNDEFFSNVSSAAYFVNGNYQTPSKEWKNDLGETMYDLRRSRSDSSN